MIAQHLWETGVPPTGTLHPQYVANTLTQAGQRFSQFRNNLVGGQLVIMMPMNPSMPDNWLYETDRWRQVDADGVDIPRRFVYGVGMVANIVAMAEQATGLRAIIRPYVPPPNLREGNRLANAGSQRGTFAIQYDPTTGQRNMWVEGEAVW